MKLDEFKTIALDPDHVARAYRTKSGVLALVIDQMLYNFCDENKQSECRGRVLVLNNTDRFYVGGIKDDKWPEIDGRDGNNVDVKKALREIQHLLEAYALRETSR